MDGCIFLHPSYSFITAVPPLISFCKAQAAPSQDDSVLNFDRANRPRAHRIPQVFFIERDTTQFQQLSAASQKSSKSTTSPAQNSPARLETKSLEAPQYVFPGFSLDGVTANVVSQAGTLDRHADGPDPGSEVQRKKTKPPWDAWERYRSKADSFPNYGYGTPRQAQINARHHLPAALPLLTSPGQPRNPKMVHKLGQFHAFRPVNTLHSSPGAASIPKDEPPAKRQKKDVAGRHPSTTSPYFSQAVPSNDGSRKGLADDLYDDRIEAQSISSTATGKTLSRHGIEEYRKSQPPPFPGVSGRNSARGNRKKYQIGYYCKKDGPPVTPSLKSSHSNANGLPGDGAADSPDVLGVEDTADSEKYPPPANITSDIRHPNHSLKRGHSSQMAEVNLPHVKRAKAARWTEQIDESEDELSGATGPDKAGRRTNFTNIHAPKRADIQSTQFKAKRNQPAAKPMPNPMRLVRAVTPRHEYVDEGDAEHAVWLHAEGLPACRLVAKNAKGKRLLLQWLDIDISKVLSCRHHSTHSRFVCLARPQSSGIPNKLYLEFETESEASALVNLLPDTIKRLHAFADKLESEMENFSHGLKNYRDRQPEADNKKVPRSLDGPPEMLNDEAVSQLRKTNLPIPKSASTEKPSLAREVPTTEEAKAAPVQALKSNIYDHWEDNWTKSLVYPATGKNRTTVDKDDISRLDEGQFLNDNLINFYIRYLQTRLEQTKPDILNKVYFFNTFFYEKLRPARGKINYDGVKAWTAKIDIFSYDYIVVPVNENAHWYLAIICNTPNTIRHEREDDSLITTSQDDVQIIETAKDVSKSSEDRSPQDAIAKSSTPNVDDIKEKDVSDLVGSSSPRKLSSFATQPTKMESKRSKMESRAKQKYIPGQPKIITLDSLGSPHSPTCTALREYLFQEAEAKKGTTLKVPPAGMTARGIPEQDNYCDCGVFILGYMEEFLQDPDEAVGKLLRKEDLGWAIRASEMRTQLRNLIFTLQEDQQKRMVEEAEKKRIAKAAKKKAQNSPTPVAPNAPEAAATPAKQQPAENAQDCNTPMGQGHKFVSPIKDTPVKEGPSPHSVTMDLDSSCTLAQSQTEDKRQSRVEVQLKSQRSPLEGPSQQGEIQFTQPLLDSSPSGSPARMQKSGGLSASERLQRRSNSSSPRQQRKYGKQTHNSPKRFNAAHTVESVEQGASRSHRGGAHYDGIDRAIDLTD
ncbi:ulp1 protease family [Paramyrothecium foliicola]|nr:ulp1 protease family [Paramyrothecium foliicola]